MLRALVIDDSRLWRRSVSSVLSGMGVAVSEASAGAEGLLIATQGSFDLICLDLHLPDLDGREVCRRLRSTHATATVPVVMLTAEQDTPTLMECALAGATDVLPKRKIDALEAALQGFVRNQQRRHEGRVLLVEDSPTAAYVARRALEGMGLEVQHEREPAEALTRFFDEDFDLVVTDLVFPSEMGGLGLVRAIRGANTHRRMCPVLVMSAFDDAVRRVELFRHGADDYVVKPLLEEEFAARVGKLVDNKKLMDQVRVQQVALRRMAEIDALTGLLNRHALTTVADRVLLAAQRGEHDLTVLVVDLDHFKHVNDTHGHATGDRVLSAVGALLRESCTRGEVAARFGGEEFLLLLPDCDRAQAEARAERVRVAIEDARPDDLTITASIGVATYDGARDQGWDALFERADAAVYAAKHAGRNCVIVAD